MSFMRVCSAVAGLLVCSAALTGCKKHDADTKEAAVDLSEPTRAQPRLPTIKLWLGPAELTAEMAVTPQQEATGMMFRTNTVEDEGMIFALRYTQQASFWMKNCYVPLSVAYIDPAGVIQEIHDLQPQNTNAVVSASDNIRFALETAPGWFQRHHVREGMTVRTERGSLMETFFQAP